MLPLVFFLLLLQRSGLLVSAKTTTSSPFPLGIAGLVHDHINEATYGLPASLARTDIQIVGIAEANQTIVAFYAEKYNLPASLFVTTVEDLMKLKPAAVQVFTDIVSHLHVVEVCSKFGVHVMVEKPLAVNLTQAQAMEEYARTSGIQVLTNYITTWYPNTHSMYNSIMQQDEMQPPFGALRKATFRTGHFGPKEIGCNPWMVEMDTDPARSGGGALMCFASYGLSILTALMSSKAPSCVSATTRHFKKDSIYARVEDDASILVEYTNHSNQSCWVATATIEPSWNWAWNRKDMDFGAVHGALSSLTDFPETQVQVRQGWQRNAPPPDIVTSQPLQAPYDNPLSYLIEASKESGRAQLDPENLSVILSGLPLNLVVMEAIDRAYESARKGGEQVCA